MKWISKLIGICIMLISIPFILVFLPFKYLKMRKRASASKLFTSHEKALLYKSQQLIKLDMADWEYVNKYFDIER
jgi:uncharacterized membrane protein YczE